jgi:hypothetical protein
MKWFKKATKYECEVAPKARVLLLTILTDDDAKLSTILAFHTPFKKWMKYIHPWHFGHTEGWCTYNCALKYKHESRKITFMQTWEPLND